MSMQGNIGAEAAAEDVLKRIQAIRDDPGYRDMDKEEVLNLVKAHAEEIRQTAKAGWY
jgi:hypothetical protein